jgi:hypothetical protein
MENTGESLCLTPLTLTVDGSERSEGTWEGGKLRQATSQSKHLATQGILGDEGDAGEDASGLACFPYTDARK